MNIPVVFSKSKLKKGEISGLDLSLEYTYREAIESREGDRLIAASYDFGSEVNLKVLVAVHEGNIEEAVKILEKELSNATANR